MDHLLQAQSVGRQLDRVDDRLDQFLPHALDRALENARHFLDLVAQRLGRDGQHALRHVAGEGDDEDGEFRDVDLVDRRFLGALRDVALGVLDLVAHVDQRIGEVGRRVELDQHVAAALIGGGLHLLEALEALELGLDRPQQQPLGILRRDALVDEADIDDRDGDIGLGFLGHRAVGERPGDDQEDEDR